MNQHIVIMGGPRAGTFWISESLRRNVIPTPDVRHEPFYWDVERVLRSWELAGMHIAVGTEASMMVPMIHRRFPDAKWVCLHRDPLKQFESMVKTTVAAAERGTSMVETGGKLHAMMRYWACNEHALHCAERLFIDVDHWHMDDFRTPAGFRALAKSLGLQLQEELDLEAGHNASFYQYSVDEDPGIAEMVMNQFGGFEYLCKAYKTSQERVVDCEEAGRELVKEGEAV